MKKYFSVIARCGHVGSGKHILKEFPIIAESASCASKIVRNAPRVKRHRKDFIESCTEVSREVFQEIRLKYESDLYFRCGNRRQQNELCPDIDSEVLENEVIAQPKKKSYDRRIKVDKSILEYTISLVQNEFGFQKSLLKF